MPPAYEVLLLNTAIPQIQAAQSGDTYVVPRDIAINATAIISANSATDALRITQTGAGNAILVEDSSNPDATPFVVTAAGSVGIGTDSPAVKLHVSDATNPSIRVTDTTNPTSVDIQAVDGVGYVGTPTNHPLAFFTNGLERARVEAAGNFLLRQSSNAANTSVSFNTTVQNALTLDSSGNLGLGVTPSAWYTSYGTKALQFAASGSLHGLDVSNSDRRVALANNDFINTSGVDTYINTGHATKLQQVAGQFQFLTAPSGNANDPITFTQAMTLDASGNLGIGITNPAVRLAVNGAARVGANVVGQYVEFSHDTANGLLSTNTGALGYSAPSFHYWSIGGTERARITSGGYFKASNTGTYANSAGLYHELRSNNADYTALITNTNATPYGLYVGYDQTPNGTGNQFLLCIDGTATRAEIRSNGGLANYQSNNVDLSDIRTKTDISPLASYWNKIAALEIVTYKYKDQTHDDLNIGVIAQQVEQVAPEFVDADGFGETPEDGVPLKTIYNKDLTFAAIKALQEAMARIEKLEAEVAALKGA